MSLLTLDNNTVFYHNVTQNLDTEPQQGQAARITEWTSQVSSFSSSKQPGVGQQSGPIASGSKRAASAALISSAGSSTDDECPPSLRGVPDLDSAFPEQLLRPGVWELLISSLIRYIGTTSNTGKIADSFLIHALEILYIFYCGEPGIGMPITASGAIFREASKRVAQWQCILRSVAIAALSNFFASTNEFKNSGPARRKFVQELLSQDRFLYQHAGGKAKDFRGLFRNGFVIHVFAAHLSIISRSDQVLELYTKDGIAQESDIPQARGALSLCGAAVKHALTLHATGTITQTDSGDAKPNKRRKLGPAGASSSRAKASRTRRADAVSATDWMEPAARLMQLCEGKLTDDDMAAIVQEASVISRDISGSHAKDADSEEDGGGSVRLQRSGGGEDDASDGESRDRDMDEDSGDGQSSDRDMLNNELLNASMMLCLMAQVAVATMLVRRRRTQEAVRTRRKLYYGEHKQT
ncbi:hypothetical protein HWV62_40886 [Athelia sp. TMB]|nr:hypothetical protein HWV62_40886 [Athelia sp. TMB]